MIQEIEISIKTTMEQKNENRDMRQRKRRHDKGKRTKKYERKLNNNGQCQEKLGQKEKKKWS